MKKNVFFFIGTVAAGLLITTACSRDKEVYQPSRAEVMANAEDKLGVKIDTALNWNMTASAMASITVNGNYGETYTVKIYSNDPLVDGKGYVLKQGKVESGGTFQSKFEYPSAESWIVVGVTDTKGYTMYKTVPVADGILETTFGGEAVAEARVTRSMTAPSVPDIEAPFDEKWVSEYAETAQTPTYANVNDNYDDTYWDGGEEPQWVEDVPASETKASIGSYNWGGAAQNCLYYPDGASEEDKAWFEENCRALANFNITDWNDMDQLNAYIDLVMLVYEKCLETGRTDWITLSGTWQKGTRTEAQGHWTEATDGHWVVDETFVKNFIISSNWDGDISVAATEGLTDGVENGNQRTIVVTGTWNLTINQRIGSLGRIIIADGGELHLSDGVTLEMVNQSRLVVLPGGELTGNGTVMVSNGNAEGQENYNGGEIRLHTFNNNFGKFYNYGKIYLTEYAAGGQESNFYNHGVVHLEGAGNRYYSPSPNARIFNACQWYCESDMRAYILENTTSSYFYVGGELIMSDGNDGTEDPSYVALENGALVRIGSLYNDNTSWVGPTSGTAVLEVQRVNFLNWTGDGPMERGYFINNIAITVSEKDNDCEGHSNENAFKVLKQYVANGLGTNGNRTYLGNGGVVFVEENGASIIIPSDYEFFAGEKGCTPGYEGIGTKIDEVPAVWTYAFEDTPLGDYDMNDVVIKVSENASDPSMLDVTLCCTGASFDLKVYLGEMPIFGGIEVHKVLGQPSGSLVNTGAGPEVDELVPTQIAKPDDFSFATADFWIESPAVVGGVHVAKTGEDPHGVAIPGDWKWPREAVNIKDAYPNFIKFAEDVEGADEEAQQWYKPSDSNPVPSKVYYIVQ